MMPSKPSPQQFSGGQPMGGQPQAGQPQQNPQADKEKAVEAIKQVLSRIMQIADQYGVDLPSLMTEMSGQGGQASAPRPPMQQAGQMQPPV